jgi:putative addiction module killer protein
LIQIEQTAEFTKWFSKLRDEQTKTRIATRIFRLSNGNQGNARNVGSGIFELKLDFGPGYRVYYVKRAAVLIILLCGGDKSTQAQDIEQARELAAQSMED